MNGNSDHYIVDAGSVHLLVLLAVIVVCCFAYGGFVMGREHQAELDHQRWASRHVVTGVPLRHSDGTLFPHGWTCSCGDHGFTRDSAEVHLRSTMTLKERGNDGG